MKTAEDPALYLRWFLRSLRDLLLVNDDLIAYGEPEHLCLHVDFRQMLENAAFHTRALLADVGESQSLSWNRLTGGDPDFPSGLLPRPESPIAEGLKIEVTTLLRQLSSSTDGRERGEWPVEWAALRKAVNEICKWSPP